MREGRPQSSFFFFGRLVGLRKKSTFIVAALIKVHVMLSPYLPVSPDVHTQALKWSESIRHGNEWIVFTIWNERGNMWNEESFLIGLCSENGYCYNGDALSAFSSREELSNWFQDQNMVSLLLWNANRNLEMCEILPSNGSKLGCIFKRSQSRLIMNPSRIFHRLPNIDPQKRRQECQFQSSIDIYSTLP